MNKSPDKKQLDELRHIWHALMQWRSTKATEMFNASYQLSVAEAGVIDIIAENPDVILREIGQCLCMPKSTLTSVIDRLETRGHARRVISQRDKRSYGLELTETGRQAYEDHLRFENATWLQMMDSLDDDAAREEFIAMLRKIMARLAENS